MVDAGWRVEWRPDSPRPFEAFTRRINDIRKRAKAAGNTLLDQTAKEVGNSAYGKTAQAVETMRSVHDGGMDCARGKRVFDARTQSMKTLPPSKITNPMLAAFTTSIVRATISEALARLPTGAVLATATTDGFLSSVPLEELDVSGPVAKEFAAARARISPDEPSVWEEKHRVGRVIVTKTRGTITTDPFNVSDPGKPVLARAGYKLERKPADAWEECAEWQRLYVEHDYHTRSRRKSLTSLRKQCLYDMDLVEETTNVRLNMDFDMKREPVDPFDREGLLCSDTRPWETLEQFTQARDGLEAWKKSQRRVLKTLSDYRDMLVWTASHEGQRASGSTAQSGRPPLVNAFIRAATRGELPPCRWTYAQLAALLSQCGVSANIDTLKNAKRRGELALGQIHDLTPAEITFARAVYLRHPECQLDKLVAPNSPAAADLTALRSSTICDHCGAAFARQKATARFCSTACRVAAGRQHKKRA